MRIIAFTRVAGYGDASLASHLGKIIYGPDFTTVWNPMDRKWNLGGQNDWWLAFDERGRGALTNRGGKSAEIMEALALVLREFVGLRDATAIPG